MMTIYLLNSPRLPTYGEYRFAGPISPEEATLRIAPGFVSAIGHPETAAILTGLLRVPVPEDRLTISMAPGDCALVYHTARRLAAGQLLSNADMQDTGFEFGWLERVA